MLPRGALRRLGQRYDELLISDPYKTKAVGTGVTYIFSDLTAQALEARDDVRATDRAVRALKFGAVGCFWIGPVLTAWFNMMDQLVTLYLNLVATILNTQPVQLMQVTV